MHPTTLCPRMDSPALWDAGTEGRMEGRMLAQGLQEVGRATLGREDGQSRGLPGFPTLLL